MPNSGPATAAPGLRPARGSRAAAWLREFSALDLRSLALFRVGLALCMLWDLALRAPLLSQLYSDEGLLPRRVLIEQVPEYVSPLALHLVSGSMAYQGLLFGLTALCALALGLGYRTGVATLLCWWLELSLQMRNPYALNGGNHQLRMALFWSLFLPLGARASLDARSRGPSPGERVCGIAPAALWIQVAFIYLGAGIAKSSPQWIQMGNALHWVAIDPDWTRPLAQLVAGYPELLRLLTFATVGLEILAPLAFAVTAWNGWLRAAAVIALIGLQSGIGVTMSLGVFPQVSIAVLLGLLPGVVWERFGASRERRVFRAAPRAQGLGAAARARAACAAICLAWVVAYNADFWIEAFELPRSIERPGRWIKLDQVWNMYHSVHRAQFRWDLHGTTASGEEVALAHPGYGPRWRERVHSLAQQPFWREYASNLQDAAGRFLRPELAAFWCREWNADAPAEHRLQRLELLYVARYLRLSGEHEPWRARSEGHFECP